MIAYLKGPILRRADEWVIVEAGGVGYEVHLPAVIARAIPQDRDGIPSIIELHISYHATQNQPRP
ncbi:MAG: OB-fold domain-containing protein, partial [bacterium]